MNIYKAGKAHGSVTASMGKKPNATGAKLTASAGAKSGTARAGDPKGCAPMGKGK
jgi:hypothetical protein